MRSGSLLAIAASAALAVLPGCRRPAPPAPPAQAGPVPSAEPAEPTEAAAPPPPSSAPQPDETPPPPAEAQPLAAEAAAPPAGELGVAPVPPAAPAAAAARPAAPREDDDALYSWEDSAGVVHFGTAGEAPPDPRRLRRVDGGGVSVLSAEPVAGVSSASGGWGGTAVREAPSDEKGARPEKGAAPQLDGEGLPVPGTMEETAHTRAVRAATGVALDPASVEREHQKQLRELNCRVVDGVTICG